MTTETQEPTIEEGRITASTMRTTPIAQARERAICCARVAEDNRGRDILVLDMTEIVPWVDYVVIATGSSRRQLTTIADEIEANLKLQKEPRPNVEGYEHGVWIVLDYGDVLVHLFNDEMREFYQLENLWGDAPRIDWSPAT